MNTGESLPSEASYLDTPLIEMNAPEFLQLIEELKEVTRVQPVTFYNHAFVHYLIQCLYPLGTVRAPLRGQDLDGCRYLSWTLRKLHKEGPLIYDLCDELARKKGSSAEANETRKLFSFLNAFVPGGMARRKSNRGRLVL